MDYGEKITTLGTDVKQEKKLVPPPIRVAAPGDFSKESIDLDLGLGKGKERLEVIRQTHPGNCTEYTTLNAAMLLSKVGGYVHEGIQEYLSRKFPLESVEKNLIIPLIFGAYDKAKGIDLTSRDVENLNTKIDSPYEFLTSGNAILLFETAFTPPKEDLTFDADNLHYRFTKEFLDRIMSQEFVAILVGYKAHSTCFIRFGNLCYYIDPFYAEDVITKVDVSEMQKYLKRIMSEDSYDAYAYIKGLRTS